MTRTELTARVQSRSDRNDATTKTLIENWINEVVETVEQAYPFEYLKNQENIIALVADQGIYTLPSTLILHHPWTFRLSAQTTPVGTVTFTGSGLDDATSGGMFKGGSGKEYQVAIDGTGSPDTFKWSDDGGTTFNATTVNITGSAQQLNDGVTITFTATTGHTSTDKWDFTTTATNLSKLVRMHDRVLYSWVESPGDPTDAPVYYVLEGGTNGLDVRMYPVPSETRVLEVTGGYFYTGAWTIGSGGDSSSNWLSVYYPDILVEGVSAKLFEHFEEHTRADRAFTTYNAFLNSDEKRGINGLIPSERRRSRHGRMIRFKTLDDFPVGEAVNLRRRGY